MKSLKEGRWDFIKMITEAFKGLKKALKLDCCTKFP